MYATTILDGGMGRELERRDAPFRQPEWSALAMMQAPEIVKDVHRAYIAAGSQVITTNSYALVPYHIGDEVFKAQGQTLAKRSAEVALAAVSENGGGVKVAGSLPPLFGSYRADLYQAEAVDSVARPLIEALNDDVDLWLNETQSLLAESVAIKALVDDIDSQKKPYWVSFTLEDSEPTEVPCLRSGETVEAAIKAMEAAGVDAILFNCCMPEIISDALRIAKATLNNPDIQIGAYANAFPPQPKDATANEGLDELRQDLSPESYLEWAKQWQTLGATLIGGCCGIGPEHIKALADDL